MSEQATAEIYRDCCEAADASEVLETLDSADVARVLKHALRLGGEDGAPAAVASAAMAVALERFLKEHS